MVPSIVATMPIVIPFIAPAPFIVAAAGIVVANMVNK